MAFLILRQRNEEAAQQEQAWRIPRRETAPNFILLRHPHPAVLHIALVFRGRSNEGSAEQRPPDDDKMRMTGVTPAGSPLSDPY
jgi:hypothetical protein